MTRSPKPRRGSPPADPDPFDDLLNEPDRTPPSAARDADGWPADVPVLTAADLVWNFSDARTDTRHDLLVWLERTFNPEYPLAETAAYPAAYAALCAVVTERFGRPVTRLTLFLEFLKAKRTPDFAWQAACWNEMLSRLGYAVPATSTADPGFHKRE